MSEFLWGACLGAIFMVFVIGITGEVIDVSSQTQCQKQTNQECVYVPQMYKPKENL